MNQSTQTHTHIHTKEAPPPTTHPPAKAISSDNSGTLDATSVFSEQCCNSVCSTEEDLKFKLHRFVLGCRVTCVTATITPCVSLSKMTLTYSNYNAKCSSPFFMVCFHLIPALVFPFHFLPPWLLASAFSILWNRKKGDKGLISILTYTSGQYLIWTYYYFMRSPVKYSDMTMF